MVSADPTQKIFQGLVLRAIHHATQPRVHNLLDFFFAGLVQLGVRICEVCIIAIAAVVLRILIIFRGAWGFSTTFR